LADREGMGAGTSPYDVAMPRDHHFAFAKRVLPGQAFQAPGLVFAELRGPMREPFLMFLWNEAGKGAPQPLPHVGNATRTPGGFPETIALDVVRVGVVGQTEVIIVQMPPALEPNEAWFVALTRNAGQVRVFTYERSTGNDVVLAEIRPGGRSNFGFFADPTLVGFMHALGGVLGFPITGLAPPVGGPPEVARRTAPAAEGKKGPLVPLALAVTFLLPGLLLFTFALGEARDFGSDWVLLSTPLLLLSAVSLAWGGGRMMGKVGYLVGGGIGLAALVVAFAVLGGRIDDRATYSANARALDDTEAFCTGGGRADARAQPYRKGQGRPSVIVFENLTPGPYSSSFKSSYDAAFRRWRTDPYQIQAATLVACIERVDTRIQTCPYDQGARIDRMKSALKVSLYAIHDGTRVLETTLEGEPPRPCGLTEKFYGSSKESAIYGVLPSRAEVRNLLAPYVDGGKGSQAQL